jgi:ribosome-associated toxin RatA of RatAB toxin-antitoxin module
MMHQRILTVLATLIFLSGGAYADVPFFNTIQKKMLEKGDVLTTSTPPTGGDGVAALVVGIVKAPVAKVWPVIRKCELYDQFMPRAKKSTLISRDGKKAVCELEISLPFPLSNLKSSVNSIERELSKGGFMRAWTLRSGTYKRNTGSWAVHPWQDNNEWTLVVYKIDVEPNTAIPDAILRKAQKSSLPGTIKAIRKRVGV